MDATKRKITKIAREVSKFTVRTMRAEGIGAGEFDVLHAVRKNPGITQAGVQDNGWIRGPSRGRRRILRPRISLSAAKPRRRAQPPAATPRRRRSR